MLSMTNKNHQPTKNVYEVTFHIHNACICKNENLHDEFWRYSSSLLERPTRKKSMSQKRCIYLAVEVQS